MNSVWNEVGKRAAPVIEAAKRIGAKRIVFTSLLHADTSPLDLAEEHLATFGQQSPMAGTAASP